MTSPRIVITYHGIHDAHGDVTDKYAYTTTRHQQHIPNGALYHTIKRQYDLTRTSIDYTHTSFNHNVAQICNSVHQT